MCSRQKVELLQAEVDEDDQSFFRLLIDGQSIKYVTIESGLYTAEDMCFGPALVALLPEFPLGDWNDRLVARDPKSGQPYFKHVARTQFSGIRYKWHETDVDYFEIAVGKKLRTGIYEITCPKFDSVVVAKFARFHWEIQYLENETIVTSGSMAVRLHQDF